MSAVRREQREDKENADQIERDRVNAGGGGITREQIEREVRRKEKKEEIKREVKHEVAKDKEPKLSLEDRIRRTEDRMADRREVLSAQLGSVNSTARRALSSPLVIVAAAAGGFLIAQIRKKRPSADRADDRPPVVVKPSLFSSLTDALTLATTILAMLPLIGRKAAEEAVDAHEKVDETVAAP